MSPTPGTRRSSSTTRVAAKLPSSSVCVAPLFEVSATIIRKPAFALLHLHALATHFLRQPLLDAPQPVLHIHLRDVDVGAGVERHRDRRGAVRLARRRHVQKAFDAVQLLLDRPA